jgi:hypothetical protein
MLRWRVSLGLLVSFLNLALLTLVGCGGGGSSSSTGTSGAITLALANNTAQVYQSQTSTTVNATLTRTGTVGEVSLTLSGLPSGATSQVQSPGTGTTGSVTVGAGTAVAGTYPITVMASDGQVQSSATLTLTIGAFVQVSNQSGGALQLAMSTSFQPAEWDYTFFQNFPGATTPLGNLTPAHIRLQGISQGVPQKADQSWDFTVIDGITQPVLGVGDHSPEYQIAVAPSFMYDSGHNFLDPTFVQFGAYTQNLVQYYNTGGFDANGNHYQSPATGDKIKYWGIYNEPNINNLTPAQYVTMYNTVVPLMQSVDPTLKFSAVELADFGTEEQKFIPTFLAGVTAQIDVLSTHFYSTCNQKDSDQQIFSTVPGFASGVQNLYLQLQSVGLTTVPVWVTENNVNADFDAGNGMSNCNPGQTFVTDTRGSSAFFAAWRPYVFSQLGKAGAGALYQWVFADNAQYGELDNQAGNTRLSYWVDYWLAHTFPSPPGTTLLNFITGSATDDGGLETLAVRNPDQSVVVMIANHAVASSSDNNGTGAPRTVLVDVSSLGTFQTASLVTIDSKTDPLHGPMAGSVPVGGQIPLGFGGYGVNFLTLK